MLTTCLPSCTADPGALSIRRFPPGASNPMTLGMPHLSPVGLGEEWLLREAGHRHWQALEEVVGIPAQHWAGARGTPLYASFVAAAWEGGLFSRASLGTVVTWQSTPARREGHVMVTRHVLRGEAPGLDAAVTLVSAFVSRDGTSNRRFVRDTLPVPAPDDPSPADRWARTLLEARRAARHQVPESRATDLPVTVVPGEDFNAAGMVYFATMPRLLDRGEWLHVRATATEPPRAPLPPVTRREVFWFGNADAGDTLHVRLGPDGPVRTSALVRLDGTALCIAHTRRA